jgi:glucose/arabinose dehydrogenase
MKRKSAYAVALVANLVLLSGRTSGQPTVLKPGYTLTKISDNVPASGIAQMAFNPNDNAHLYVARSAASVTRYDYDPVTGSLSAAVDVATGLGEHALGVGFYKDDLYVAFDNGGSITQRPGDGRITRLSDPDQDGVYRVRHDFVHSINKGNHDVNQVQIVGDTLYVGIGAVGRTGNPREENIYTMTIARIVDLGQIDFSGPIDADFKGPINYLADETEWLNTAGTDGQLRYYASGFRNPFGIAIDPDGDLWVSCNGNSDAGFLSHDFLYKKVPLGGQGVFPLESFGFGPPHITGTPITPFLDLGQSPSPTGFDFIPTGPDQGKILLAEVGSSTVTPPVGRDVLLIDPNTGQWEQLITFPMTSGPTDVVRDPFGRMLIADHEEGDVWLLTPPAVTQPPELEPGDADQDLDFDQLDLIQVQQVAKYLTALPAAWGEGDWDGAPGGQQGNPPAGNGFFDQLDIIAALAPGHYLIGPYAALRPSGQRSDGQTSIGYNPSTGEVFVDAPAGVELTSINVDSSGAIFTGAPAQNVGGSFDNDADNNIFKATFGSSFGSLSFGNVAQRRLSAEFMLNDLTVVGSLAGGGGLGEVDLIYVPEPGAPLLLAFGMLVCLWWVCGVEHLAGQPCPPSSELDGVGSAHGRPF